MFVAAPPVCFRYPWLMPLYVSVTAHIKSASLNTIEFYFDGHGFVLSSLAGQEVYTGTSGKKQVNCLQLIERFVFSLRLTAVFG